MSDRSYLFLKAVEVTKQATRNRFSWRGGLVVCYSVDFQDRDGKKFSYFGSKEFKKDYCYGMRCSLDKDGKKLSRPKIERVFDDRKVAISDINW